MTKKEQFISIWVKKLPDSEQQAFVRQLEGLLQPVEVKPRPRQNWLQKLVQWRARRKYNTIARELAAIRAVEQVYATHAETRTLSKIARIRGRRALLETYAQQIRAGFGEK